MSIADCLARQVASGMISQKTADSANQMHQRMQREFTTEMGPASADAAAALAAAKQFHIANAQKLRAAAAQVTAYQNLEKFVRGHPAGTRAALADLFTRSIWRDTKAYRDLPADHVVKNTANLEALARNSLRELTGMLGVDLEKLKPGAFGFSPEQEASIDNIVYKLFGVDRGDKLASTFGDGFAKAADHMVTRAQALGKIFSPLEDWRLPQWWNATRVKALGKAQILADWTREEAAGTLQIWDRDTNRPVTAAKKQEVLDRAYRDIVYGGGPTAPMSKERRTFVFAPGQAGAEAYLRMQKKYGPGANLMSMFMSHLERGSRELALLERFGPGSQANWAAIKKLAMEEPAIPTTAVGRFNPARLVAKLVENESVIDGMWNIANGNVHPAHDGFINGLFGALRNLNVASGLRQAVITVGPGDFATHLITAGRMGMDPIQHAMKLLSGGLSKADAQHLAISSARALDFVHPLRDYEDQLSLLKATGVIGRMTTRFSGLDFWARHGKNIWGDNMLRHLATQLLNPFDRIPANLKQMLDAYGVDAKDWATLQASPKLQVDQVRYLDPNDLMTRDRDLYHRVMTMIDEQGAFAMHQPDYRIRSIERWAADPTQGFPTQLWRSFMQFKTFALSRMTTHMMRMLTDGSEMTRVKYATAFMALGVASGALSLQALQLVNGKDLRDMTKPGFWAEAFLKSGMAGYYGELMNAVARGDRSVGDIATELAGPTVRAVSDAARLAFAPIKEEFDPQTGRRKQSTLGRDLISMMSRMTPSTWYTRIAIDRLLWDNLQTLIDPDYRKSWSRQEKKQQKDMGADFFWPRGSPLPTRMPAFGTAFAQ